MLAAAVLPGCAGSQGRPTVAVTLREYAIVVQPATVPSGNVTFRVRNTGGATHELVVVRAPPAARLPTNADGSVDESEIPPADRVGEQRAIAPGASVETTLDLARGSYILFCNVVVRAGRVAISHFQRGMHALLSVS